MNSVNRFGVQLLAGITLGLGMFFSSGAQPYSLGHVQETLSDPNRAGRSIGVEFYYPASSAGEAVPLASGTFPILVFGHGFLMTWNAYQPYWDSLVQHGYILAFPTTEGSFSPVHAEFAKDLSRVAQWLRTENSTTGSRWENHISSKSAVMGHSMGGGAAFLAMQNDTSFTTLIGIAAAETNPSAIQSAQSISRPVLQLAGENDCVTPIPQHQQPLYDNLPAPSRCLVSITGGSHCQFAASNLFCNTGESTCQPGPAISAVAQQALSLQMILPWINFYLKDDCPAGTLFQQRVSNPNGMSIQQTGILSCNALGLNLEKNDSPLIISPNPASGLMRIQTHGSDKIQQVAIFDAMGKKILDFSGKEDPIEMIDVSLLTPGIYLLRVSMEGFKYSEKTIRVER